MTTQPNENAVAMLVTTILENADAVKEVLITLADTNYLPELEGPIADASGLVRHLASDCRVLQQLLPITTHQEEATHG